MVRSTPTDLPPQTDRSRVIARRYQLHLPGFVYVLLTALLVLGAVNSQNNLLFAIFGVAVAGIIVSGIVSGAAIMGLRIEREIVGEVEAGQILRVRYRVRNTNWLIPSAGLAIEEVTTDRKGRHASTWSRHLSPIAAFVPWLRAGEELIVEGKGKAHTRGTATLNLVRITTTFPFGLTKKSVLFSQESAALITPWIAPIDKSSVARVTGGWEGERAHRTTRALEGEFFAMRDYVRGDSPRAVAWRATARRGHLVVRQNTEHQRRRLALEINPATMRGAPLEIFVAAVAGLGNALVSQGAELELRAGNTSVAAGSGPRQQSRITRALAQLPAPPDLPSATRANDHSGSVLLRSLDGDGSTSLSYEQLVAFCSDWSAFPTPIADHPTPSTSLAMLVRRLFRRATASKGGHS